MDDLSTAMVAALKEVDQSTVRRAIREGRLKGRKTGRDYLIKRRDADDWTPVYRITHPEAH